MPAGAKAIPKEEPIYAIVRAGGRQYRVEPEQQLDVDRIQAEAGSTVDLDVLMIGGNGEVRVGTPTVPGARVVAEVLEHGRDAKILVFKYKNKTRYRRRHGHRQDFTRLTIRQIIAGPGELAVEAEAPGKPAARHAVPKAAVEAEAPAKPARRHAVPKAAVEAEAPAKPAGRRPGPKAAVEAEAPAKPAKRRAQPKAKASAEPLEAAPAAAPTEAKPRRPRAPKATAAAPEATAEAKPAGRARRQPAVEGEQKPRRRPAAVSEPEAAAAAELTVEETPLEPPPEDTPPATRPRRPTRQEGR